jgi:molybdate transport system substrate-binding protein
LTIPLYIDIYNGMANLASYLKEFLHKKIFNLFFYIGFILFFVTPIPISHADEIYAAVATNFHNPLKALVKEFEKRSEHKVIIISGSTGKLYAQIVHGAPFDIFLSADEIRPQLLIKEGRAISGTQYSYALGKITLWSPSLNIISDSLKSTFLTNKFSHIAIANPITAPYGMAALQTIKKIGLLNKLKPLIVYGENIGQVFHFVFSKNAELGFVALSQILDPKNKLKGHRIDIPSKYYDPIKQDIVVLRRGKNNKGAMDLWHFLKSRQAQEIIKQYGYELS